jgi:2,3-bisphosphoglycerate-independent phosphoglycerate mutase
MVPESVIKSLSIKTPAKIVLLVMDGLGGLPSKGGRTELESARTPNLDALAKESELGLTDPISIGVTPGSGPSHLALFGYDPLRHEIGRGVLEALGVGLHMTARDVASRGNFATMENGVITDRRAGRIPTEKNEKICAEIAKAIPKVEDVEIIIEPGKEHRFTILFRGDGLDGRVADADPQKTGHPPIAAEALDPAAARTAKIINEFIQRANDLLKDHHPANTVLMRGFAKYPDIPSMTNLFKLSPAAIATYPMYRGLAKLVGMSILDAGDTIESEFARLKAQFAEHDFFYVHIKKTDSYGEDGDFDHKVAIIEETDGFIPALRDLKPDVIAVTCDHSTPAALKGHSWHACPFMIWSPYCRNDGATGFSETQCKNGSLGRFPAVNAMTLMLANALKLEKFGA